MGDPWWMLTPALVDGMSQIPAYLSLSAQSPLCPHARRFHVHSAAITSIFWLWVLDHTQHLALPSTQCSVPNCSTLQHSQQPHVACVQAGMNIGDVFMILYKHIMPRGFILHLAGVYRVINNAESAFRRNMLHAVQ